MKTEYKQPEQFEFFAHLTVEQMRASYARCVPGQRKAEARARATGKKVGGITADGWKEMADRFEWLSKNFTR